jgi:stearoyl-CoA desaturase (delta-9 desaturase)
LKWQPGEGWTFFWICLIHGLAALGLILFPLPHWGILVAAYAVMWIGGLGTTVAYHRSLAHRAVKLNPVVEFFLTGAAMLNGSGSPATWTANHRLHHARSDGPEDISSPRVGGFWWAHLRWLWQTAQSPIPRWAPDLDTPYYRFWTRWQVPILALALCIGLPFGWKAFFWLGAIRLVVALHAQCVTNSFAHMRRGVRAGEESSQNVGWLAPVQALQGENWHANHHSRPSVARLGWTWKQIDLGWWFIVLLENLHLATKVRR